MGCWTGSGKNSRPGGQSTQRTPRTPRTQRDAKYEIPNCHCVLCVHCVESSVDTMSSEDEQIAQRRSNLEGLATLGVEIYPRAFDCRDAITALVEAHGGRTHDELEADRPQALTGGRILAIRSFGKANF